HASRSARQRRWAKRQAMPTPRTGCGRDASNTQRSRVPAVQRSLRWRRGIAYRNAEPFGQLFQLPEWIAAEAVMTRLPLRQCIGHVGQAIIASSQKKPMEQLDA